MHSRTAGGRASWYSSFVHNGGIFVGAADDIDAELVVPQGDKVAAVGHTFGNLEENLSPVVY